MVKALRRLPSHQRAYAATGILAELLGAAALVREMRGDAIREMRALGLTAIEIGELIGVSQHQVANFERCLGARRAAAAED